MSKVKKFTVETKLFILFLLIGLLPIQLTIGIYYLSNKALQLLLVELLVGLVIATGFIVTKRVASPIHGFTNQLDEVSFNTQELSKRTQEQASTLEEIASTIEEVNATIHHTSANSEVAEKLAQSTLNAVKAGERSIQETIGAMGQISASSRQIAEIIEVVNDIASQTNLLAINASVEAARAGEQGRGFAIVASEIKSLAHRTSESAKEIEKLIKESAERVEKGNSMVLQSADNLKQIVTNTVKTSDVIAEVAATMREQAVATQQMENAVDQLNQITQQNAAMVEEIFTIKPQQRQEAASNTRSGRPVSPSFSQKGWEKF
ncbi:MAG TPA: methyl-accepting chemotaxis protein [Bacillota bacterium]|nr:methyl-accepting chemotaxis protein [Bacillota bacterium]